MTSRISIFLTGLLTLLTAALLALAPVGAKSAETTRTAGYFSGTSLQNIAVDAGTNSLSQTAFYGGSLKDNLGSSLQSGLINEGTGFAQNFVGGIKGFEGSPVGVIGHGLVGCVSSDLSGGNCGRGFVNAAGAEIATGLADKAYGKDSDKVKKVEDLIGNTVNPTLAALTSGGDLGQFSTNRGISDSQLQNNYLTHAQRDTFLLLLSTCNGDEERINKWAENYSEISDENNVELVEAIATGDLDKIEELRAQIPTDLLEYQIYVSSLLKDDPRAAGEFANVLNEGSVVNINGNLITASDATFYALRDGYYDNEDVESVAGLGVSEFGPMGMSPNLAGLLGARGITGIGRGLAVPESPGSYSFRFQLPEKSVKEPLSIKIPYSRPSGATTKAQREAVQGQPCVDCGILTPKQVADHKVPLVREYYETGTINETRMRSLEAVQPQCPTCSARQGAEMSRYSRQKKEEIGK